MIRVKKNILYVFSSIIWLLSGIKVINTGLNNCFNHSKSTVYMVILSLIVFSVFHFFIFKNVIAKNRDFVLHLKGERHLFTHMMPLKQYLIILLMIALGVCIKTFHLFDTFTISFFYTGLGAALLFAGIKFMILASKK